MFKHEVTVHTKEGIKTYSLLLTYKRMKSIVFRPSESEADTFLVSLPYGTRLSKLEEVFKKNYKSLRRTQAKVKSVPFSDTTFIFGEELSLIDIKIKFNLSKLPSSLEEFYALTKNTLLSYLEESVGRYTEIMDIPAKYKIRIKSMKSRWASNSKNTFSLSFNEKLIHYHRDVIDALVVHELTHHYVAGHGPKFYEVLEKYAPRYKKLDKALKEHNYEYH